MDGFPRTVVGGVSVSRMIIGTNWFLGFSHTTRAKDAYIRDHMDRKKIAEIIGVFLDAGVDTLLGPPWLPVLREGIEDGTGATYSVWRTRGGEGSMHIQLRDGTGPHEEIGA